MTDEFFAVLKLVRTDFKEINSFFTDTHDSVEEVIRIMNKHKLGTYILVKAHQNMPEYIAYCPQD
ncbi:hypothetical protein [Syntrophaceticus schinkii]|jgi:Mg2+ and Co2+ transporter CorA|uniref:Uncharacterized protein n=1 Tax=Syntrophaceticus schinkii TaxID=499207 RepID=A0A0B7MKJ4_9FIRM|nr:hypothetical protein [Syntrophaceticus schinkii]MDD2503298.1 hypothetical protein [Clostridia bacterium]CEO88177.1 hypothetical protein SSCH_1530004 [Syntrophaceticus schinkii]